MREARSPSHLRGVWASSNRRFAPQGRIRPYSPEMTGGTYISFWKGRGGRKEELQEMRGEREWKVDLQQKGKNELLKFKPGIKPGTLFSWKNSGLWVSVQRRQNKSVVKQTGRLPVEQVVNHYLHQLKLQVHILVSDMCVFFCFYWRFIPQSLLLSLTLLYFWLKRNYCMSAAKQIEPPQAWSTCPSLSWAWRINWLASLQRITLAAWHDHGTQPENKFV